jgi:Holliday junction resolvase
MIDDNVCILGAEAEYYDYFNYETNNKKSSITYCFKCWYDDGYDKERATIIILETPFDWTGYHKLFWWGDPKPENETELQALDSIAEIIERGESNQVEFKTTLHFKTFIRGEETIQLKDEIAKTICAFLNSNGGFLFIGIKNNKEIEGLDFDFSLAKKKDPKDHFQIQFDNMLQQFIGFSIKNKVSCQFCEIEGKEVFCVEVRPSKKRLIFLKGKECKELWVRGEASTRQIRDVEEIINYWKDRQGD